MPGCGKTRLGKILARELVTPFFDLDGEIVFDTGKLINTIFELDGEAFFRDREHDLLCQLSEQQKDFVMATGGGAPCFHNNMDVMNKNGVTVFLDVPLSDIFDKLNKRGTRSRPLLKKYDDDALQEELKAKYDARITFYQQANIIIKNGFDTDINLRVNEIISGLNMLKKQSDT